jgi:hypothetical protein
MGNGLIRLQADGLLVLRDGSVKGPHSHLESGQTPYGLASVTSSRHMAGNIGSARGLDRAARIDPCFGMFYPASG